jgi:hypothetical protein
MKRGCKGRFKTAGRFTKFGKIIAIREPLIEAIKKEIKNFVKLPDIF